MAEPGCLQVTATAYPRGPGHSGIQISRSHLGCSSHGALSPGHRAAQLPVWPCSGLGIVLGSPMGWRLERACTSLPGQTGPWGGHLYCPLPAKQGPWVNPAPVPLLRAPPAQNALPSLVDGQAPPGL